jgi:putative transposase
MRAEKVFSKRPPRLILSSGEPLYFITFCTHRRHAFLANPAVHEAFRLFAERAYNERYVAVGRYVIMPDHVHLFIRGDEEFMLGRWVAALKQALAKSAGRAKSTGRIWQEGFFDHVLRNDESYAQKWKYVRQNPVRAGLVTSAEDWEYQGEIVIIDRV